MPPTKSNHRNYYGRASILFSLVRLFGAQKAWRAAAATHGQNQPHCFAGSYRAGLVLLASFSLPASAMVASRLLVISVMLLMVAGFHSTSQATEIVYAVRNFNNDVAYFPVDATVFSGTRVFATCGPTDVVGHPNGNRLYTVSQCVQGPSEVGVLDLNAAVPNVIARLPLAGGTFGLDIHPNASKVYIADF